jgi:hypothetical protein
MSRHDNSNSAALSGFGGRRICRLSPAGLGVGVGGLWLTNALLTTESVGAVATLFVAVVASLTTLVSAGFLLGLLPVHRVFPCRPTMLTAIWLVGAAIGAAGVASRAQLPSRTLAHGLLDAVVATGIVAVVVAVISMVLAGAAVVDAIESRRHERYWTSRAATDGAVIPN